MSTAIRLRPFFDNGFDTAFDDLVRRGFGAAASGWVPPADIVQAGEDVVLTFEVPGVRPEDIDIEVRERTLTIRGERTAAAAAEDVRVVRRELRHGEFARSFRLPSHVGPEAVSASYEHGVLTVTVDGARPVPVSHRVPITSAEQGPIG